MADCFDLERFVTAQYPIWTQVREELLAGCKRSHWMWFIFPQIVGLGCSATSRYYAITSLDEARAYLAHSVLGKRLIESTSIVNAIEDRTPLQIFGGIDELKFRSSMTLFTLADPEEPAFRDALKKYFHGASDPSTIDHIGRTG